MPNQIRVGLIGASWFADLWFLPVLCKHPGVTVAAICSRNGTNAERMAAKYDIPAVYTSAIEMMDTEKLDGVCIITPNDTHFPLTMEAMRRGIHVLCEKPLALDSKQSHLMRIEAELSGVVHAVNFSVREHPGVQYLRNAVKEGKIGNLLEGRFEYTGDYGLKGSPGWRGSVREGGTGGVLQDLGSHIIDLAQYITGEPVAAVQSSVRCLEEGRLVDFTDRANPDQAADTIMFQADFESGWHGVFHTSWIRAQGNGGQTITLELFGTGGGLKLVFEGYGYKLLTSEAGGTWNIVTLPSLLEWDLTSDAGEDRFRPYRNTEKNEAWRWADAVLAAKYGGDGQVPELPDFTAADRVQHVIDAVMQSAQMKRKVGVHELQPQQ
ncbi:Gfo/Idh/MocA family protein [Paenibacillus spongiae]|uniref:Gfo/Idh/MocA family oxidoreductase n=1 Tax=Paenibacillus spongiae TaxID=2909671 RepID=A0ABY5S3W1_9BACL|nr:Gfo/Idh/MocA family oxidoreductase [Paenibacillus spongiae]UVI28265.1 Gfo/Idh/MocA family oxidoreductase [Paenibacillus spongiae]